MKAYSPDGSRVDLPPWWEGVCEKCQCRLEATNTEVDSLGTIIECPVCRPGYSSIRFERGGYVRLGL